MKKTLCYILLAIFSMQILTPFGVIQDVLAVTDSYEFSDDTNYSVSSSDVYIHGGNAKLKGSIAHRAHLENGPAAMDWATNVVVDGNYAYVTGYGAHAVTAIDISNPANMSHAGYIGANSITRLYGAYDLKKVGNYVYVASYIADSLEVIDATDPTNLVHLGKITNTTSTKLDGVRGIDVVGNYAYIASYVDDALQIIDISNPAAPVGVGYVQDKTKLNGAMSVKVVGNYAYVASYTNDSLEVVDVSDPTAPAIVGSLKDNATTELNGAWGIDVAGNYAYIAGHVDDGLEIVDISDPTNPTHVGEIQNTDPNVRLNGARTVKIAGNYAYITASVDDSIEVINISNPANPTHAGYYDTSSFGVLDGVYGMDISGTDVFVTSYNNASIMSFDISTATSPTFTSEFKSGPNRLGNPVGILVEGDYAYIGSYGSNALEIVDISDSSNPIHAGALADHSTNHELFGPWDIEKKGDYVYVSGYGDSGLQVVDVSDPTAPVGVAKILDSGTTVELHNPRGLHIQGNFLYVTGYSGDALQIIDITTPTAPVARGNFKSATLLNGSMDVRVSGDYAYVTSYISDNISVIDISDPDNPSFVTEIKDVAGLELNGTWNLDIDGNFLYVLSYVDAAVVVMDISDPTNPVYLGDRDDDGPLRMRYPRGIVYDEGYAYVSTYSDDSVVVLDVSDPSDIILIDQIYNNDLYETSTQIDKQDNDIFTTQYLGSSMSVIRESYPTTSPHVIPDNHINSNYFNALNVTYGTYNEGNVTFQLSKDNGATWHYFNGTSWVNTSGGVTQSNSPTIINTNIAGFNALGGTGQIKWKAFLNSNGTQKVEIDKIEIDYFDITPPVIENPYPTQDLLLPKHNFDITFDYFDVDGAYGSGSVTENNGGIGIDTSSAILELYKWDGTSSWGSDIANSYITSSGATIGAGSALYPTVGIPYGKYKMDFEISDNNGNTTTESKEFYIDEPEFIISTPEIDLGVINDTSNTFSDSVTVTVKTIGAGFDVTMNTSTLLYYAGENIISWNGNLGYGYDLGPTYSGNISAMGIDQNIATQNGVINTDGEKNIYTYELKLGAIIDDIQAGGDYTGNIDFGINLTY